MRFFINAMLAFAFVGLTAGLVPVSAQHLARLQTMKSELAAAGVAQHLYLRTSLQD